MTIKVILVPVTAAESGALKCAFALGRRFDAHVMAIYVRADPRNAMPYMGEGMSGIVLQEILAAAERDAVTRARNARTLFDTAVAEGEIRVREHPSPGFSTSWREEVGREDEIVAKLARLSDIIVVGSQGPQASAAVGLMMEAALLSSGRPVLVAPPGGVESFGGRVAIAWNGSAEASRAVAAAMPFLEAAESIFVLVAGEGDEPANAAADLQQYLTWHGLSAETILLHPGPEGIGSALLTEAKSRSADLLVMGAYTHNRFRQMIFGGVTRHILTEAGLPVLTAH